MTSFPIMWTKTSQGWKGTDPFDNTYELTKFDNSWNVVSGDLQENVRTIAQAKTLCQDVADRRGADHKARTQVNVFVGQEVWDPRHEQFVTVTEVSEDGRLVKVRMQRTPRPVEGTNVTHAHEQLTDDLVTVNWIPANSYRTEAPIKSRITFEEFWEKLEQELHRVNNLSLADYGVTEAQAKPWWENGDDPADIIDWLTDVSEA